MVNPIWLQTYITLVNEGHFTRTATVLNMTQPGVTQHLQKLEAYFECTLLSREGKHLELTSEGRRVYDFAQQQITTERQLKSQLTLDDPSSGVCNLASSSAAALRLYPHFIGCQKASPKLIVQLEVASNQRILQLVEKRQIDLGFVTMAPQKANIASTLVGEEPLYLVIAKSVRRINWGVLTRMGFINHPDGFNHARLVLGSNFKEFSSRDQLPISGYVSQVEQILLPISQGLGFSVLPASVAEGFEGVHTVKLKRLVKERLYAIHHADQPLAARYRHLLNKAIEVYSTERE